MKADLTEIVFILDRSGSMAGLEKDTIGGFNSLLEKQRKEKGEAIVSTVLFDDRREVIHNRVDISNVKNMTENEYYVRGCTALLDAVGYAIETINKAQKSMSQDKIPGKTMFIITTDGMENASRDYDYEKIRKMIEKKKEKKGWEFLFLGANIDAVDEASKFGIREDRAVRYRCDAKGTELNFGVLSDTIGKFRRAEKGQEKMALMSWCEDIETDYMERGDEKK